MSAEIGLKSHIEHLNKDFANVMANPLLEDIHEKVPILLAPDGAFGYQVSGLGIKQTLAAGLLAPTEVGDSDRLVGGALNDGDELQPLGAHLVAKESIDLASPFLIGGVHSAEDIEFDTMLAEMLPAQHYPVKRALLGAVEAVGVVEFTWAVDAQADQKVVLLEERAPLVIQKNAVGLKSVFHGLPGFAVLLDNLDRTPEEVELHQRRFPSLPRHRYRRRAVRFQQLTDVGLQRDIGHPVRFVGIQRVLG